MKVLLYSRYGQYPAEIESLVKSFGLEIVTKNPASPAGGPEVIISYGGDGTFLGAEKKYPGVPKLYLKNSGTCFHCSPLSNKKLLELLVQNKLHLRQLPKLEAKHKDKTLLAVNDIVISKSLPNSALRFKISPKPDQLIGDGIVVATPFGSTAYFYAITRTTFPTGIGLAFNNIHNSNLKLKLFSQSATISVTIIRGPAVLAADNNPDLESLKDGDTVRIKKSPQTAQIYTP